MMEGGAYAPSHPPKDMMMLDSFETIEDALHDGVLVVTINRPERKNALMQSMYLRLAQLLTRANTEEDIRSVLLYGGEEVFCAGNDIREFAAARPPEEAEDETRPSTQFMNAVLELRKPLLAAVNGPAVGVGATLLLHCDLVFAGHNAHILFPFVRLGLCPEFGSSMLLGRIVGQRRAMQLLLSGGGCRAEQALAWGLVNELIEPSMTFARALEAAKEISGLPPAAVATTKDLMLSSGAAEVRDQIVRERVAFKRLLGDPAAQEIFKNFLDKSKSKS